MRNRTSLAFCKQFLLALLMLFSAGLLASCGGGHDDDDNPPGAATGSLAVTIAGLPAGINGAVTITGPASYSKLLTASTTLADLAPGAYAVTAANIAYGTGSLAGTPATQQVQVTAGATTAASVAYAATAPLALQEVASGLQAPTFLTAPAGDSRLFIIERAGRIRIVANGALLPTPFLDISSLTTTTGERGLLSMAFHPQYASNGYFFLYYTNLAGDIVIERRQVSAGNANVADPLSGLAIITIAHPGFSNHNGGLVSFGTDGYLYAATGDGGGAGDPSGNAQNTSVLLGKMLRLDVNASTSAQPYTIPAGNPFAGTAGGRAEIWAYGLRNPWRYAFDTTAQLLYIADVGQGQREEVNVAAVGTAGNNYGWKIMEGKQCYDSATCNQAGLVLPAIDYGHDSAGGCSITGGYVYRGAALPELAGHYLYSDYCSGWLKSFTYSNGSASAVTDWNITNVGNILSFGQDANKELYMLSATGSVYRVVRK